MNFYISKIRLWFRQGGEPRDLVFYKDKVNVITGDSSTGKSSVLKIIDYCLLSERSTIVEDVINENVAWYGLVFYVDEKPYSIIRKAPTVENAEMTAIFREGESFPDEPVADINDVRSVAFTKMNELFHINSKLKIDSEVQQHFRYNLMFNYLTEDIIATENTYLDLRFFVEDDYSKVVNDIFKMAIGVNEEKLKELEIELQEAKSQHEKKIKNKEKERKKQENFKTTKLDIDNQIEELGLEAATCFGDDPKAWAEHIKTIVENCSVQFEDENANERRKQIEKELNEIQEQLGYFISLEKEYRIHQERLKRQERCLAPIEYVKKHLSELMNYQETGQLLRELSEAWEAIKKSYVPDVKLPESFEEAKDKLEKQKLVLQQELNKLNPYNVDRRDIVWIRKAILLAERMEKELAHIPKMTITDEVLRQSEESISQIQEKLSRLRAKNNNAIGALNESILKYFKSQQGLSESYRNYRPVFSTEKKMLMLEKENGEYPKANIGSKSNYMFLHLCFFFGLHDLLLENKNEHIPQFLFIDQPSIPYYADKDVGVTSNDDRKKLTEAFKLTDMFMKMAHKKDHFQIIMIEHAGEEYWDNLDTFDTRYNFKDGEGLIPSRITNHNHD